MFERILRLSIYQSGFVLVAVLAMAAFGMYNYLKLPIDAVPRMRCTTPVQRHSGHLSTLR